MTVSEMIEELIKMPQDKQIMFLASDGYLLYPSIPSLTRKTNNRVGFRTDTKRGEEIVVI